MALNYHNGVFYPGFHWSLGKKSASTAMIVYVIINTGKVTIVQSLQVVVAPILCHSEIHLVTPITKNITKPPRQTRKNPATDASAFSGVVISDRIRDSTFKIKVATVKTNAGATFISIS